MPNVPHLPSPAVEPADDAPPAPPGPGARITRLAAVSLTLALIALGLAWELRLAPTGSGTLAIKVLPLALPLVGLMKYRLRSYRTMSLLLWLYVAEGLVRGTSEGGLAMRLAWVEVMLGVLLFAACATHVRLRLATGRMA